MKKAYFFIDDVIWLFRDLTRQRPASMFDNFFLKELKKAHDLYGAKFQLNVFYRTDFYYGNDEFTLFCIRGYIKNRVDGCLLCLHNKTSLGQNRPPIFSAAGIWVISGWFRNGLPDSRRHGLPASAGCGGCQDRC